jgi:hypothetical protein
VVIVVERKHAEDIVVLVARFAVIASLLLVPVVAVWITLSSLFRWRIDIATVLKGVGKLGLLARSEGGADLGELRLESCCCGDEGSSKRAGRYNAPRKHAVRQSESVTGAIVVVAYVAAQLRGF